jgi:transcriptional regulator with GAF, ATPase, and Fis domain
VLAKGPVLELGPDFLLADLSGQPSLPAAPAPARAAAAAPPPRPLPAPDDATAATVPGPMSLEEVGKQHILSVLESCGGVIEGPRGAARLLGLQPSTLRSRLKKLGLQQRPSRATP